MHRLVEDLMHRHTFMWIDIEKHISIHLYRYGYDLVYGINACRDIHVF